MVSEGRLATAPEAVAERQNAGGLPASAGRAAYHAIAATPLTVAASQQAIVTPIASLGRAAERAKREFLVLSESGDASIVSDIGITRVEDKLPKPQDRQRSSTSNGMSC